MSDWSPLKNVSVSADAKLIQYHLCLYVILMIHLLFATF
jgi:hypothetical protein